MNELTLEGFFTPPMLKGETVQLVASIPLVAGLEPEERELVLRLIRVRTFKARQVVVWEGEAGTSLFVVLSGYLKAVTAGSEGKEVLLSVMGPGEVFGELSVLDGEPRSATVVALEETELALIERDPLLSLIQSSPTLAVRLLVVLTQRLRNLSKRCETLASLSLCGRLAEVLVGLALKHGEPHDGSVRIPMRLSQQDLGSMVGASRESVNKLLRYWAETGVLRHDGGRVVITDFEALKLMTLQ
jgi:CRP/FNR family cyclic AMP-dependent transcriptional regulator